MESLSILQSVLWSASLLGELLVAARLFQQRLVPSYPFFTAFLLAEASCNVVLMRMDFRGSGYAGAFRICTWLMLIFRLGVIGELYERICGHFPGIGKFRAGMAGTFVLLSAIVTVFTFHPNLADKWLLPQTGVEVVQRCQSEIVAFALILTWIFLRFFLSIRQPLRLNVLRHWTVATIYFGASGAAFLLVLWSRGEKVLYLINCGLLGVQVGCFVAWLCLMRRSGEELPAFPRLSVHQAEAIQAYNRELINTVKSLPGQISARQAEN